MILGRGKSKHKMQTSTSMITRPMNLVGSEIDYAERTGAAFLPTLESHVLVPLFEAIISGLFAGLFAGTVVFILAIVGNQNIWTSLLVGFVTSLLGTFAMAWLGWHNHLGDYKQLLWYTEFAEGPEIVTENRHKVEGTVRINSNWVHSDLPFDRDNPQALVDFAKGVISGATPFSERGAGRYGYSVQRFNELRDNFIKGKLAYWKDSNNKRLGVGLNAGGHVLLKSVADNPPPNNYEPSEDWGMSPNVIQK